MMFIAGLMGTEVNKALTSSLMMSKPYSLLNCTSVVEVSKCIYKQLQ